MTVKPPGGPAAAPPIPPETPESKGPSGTDAFRAELERGDPTVPVSTVDSEVAQKVREGRMTVAEAVETLVDRTLQDPAFSKLAPERLEALRTELREVIASDPTLAGLAAQIGR